SVSSAASLWQSFVEVLLIALKQEQLIEMREHGERDYPFECCGLMLGSFAGDGRKLVKEIYPISNAREEEAKRNRFLIRPEELMLGEKHARDKGLDVVGLYHSHPDDQAVPAQYHLGHPRATASYILVSVRQGRAAALPARTTQ